MEYSLRKLLDDFSRERVAELAVKGLMVEKMGEMDPPADEDHGRLYSQERRVMDSIQETYSK